jgi:hypothetical protein
VTHGVRVCRRFMLKSIFTGLFVFFALAVPALTFGQATSSTPPFAANLQLWDRGSEVLSLQQFLNQHGFPVSRTGAGSSGQETDFFGLKTYAALVKFQAAEGLPATGFFGPLTRAAIARVTATGAPTNAQTTASSTPPATTFSGIPQLIPLPAGYTPGYGGGGGTAGSGTSGGGSSSDTTPPTVSLTAPTNGATVSGTAVALSATASDNVAVASVQFKADGTNIGSAAATSPYSTTWNSKLVADGSHTIAAVAEDTSGNYATSSIGVTVDNTPPVISTISVSTTTTTSSSAVITWTTNEAASSTVSYGITSAYGTASSSASLATSHSITLAGLTASSTYHFQVQSSDGQGNTATSSDQTFTTANYASIIQNDPNLIAFWRMGEASGSTFVDSKSGLNATISGGVTLGTTSNYIVGDPSTAATFDGITGSASIGDVSALNNFTRTAPFTITAIITPTATPTGNGWIYTKANVSGALNGLEFGIRNVGGGRVGLFVQFGSVSQTQWIRLVSTQSLVNFQTYLVGVTYDGSGTAAGMQLYINGVPVPSYDDSGTSAQSIAAGQVTTAVGFPADIGMWGTIHQRFTGNIKDLAIFNVQKSPDWMEALVVAANPALVNVPVVGTDIYTPYMNPRPQVIYDLDIDSDAGDAAEAVMMLNLEHQGLLDIVATVVTSCNSKAAPAWLAIANYYGRASIPTGVNMNNSPGNCVSPNNWVQTVASTYGVPGYTDASDFEAATTTLRRLLAAAPDHSVDWITNGDLGTVQLLLETTADSFSPLTGVQLVAQKIHSLWVNGGNWPTGAGVSDISGTTARSTVTAYVLANWPTNVPILLESISEGNSVQYGANVMEGLNASNPARLAWETYFGNTSVNNTDGGWSSIAFLALVHGLSPYQRIAGGNGTASVNTSTDVTSWTQTTNSNHSWLSKLMSDADLVTATNALIIDHSLW